jgi:Flp pilus assembly pilin Flp
MIMKGKEMKALNRFLRDESGLETVEWAFVLGFVVLTAVLAFVGAQGYLTTIFQRMNTELSTAATFGAS